MATIILRPDTICSCGAIMQPRRRKGNILTCLHCDGVCEVHDCDRCRQYDKGCGKKLLANWNPLSLYIAVP